MNRTEKISYRLVVRGHWRHFRGKKIWVRPYIKGEGLLGDVSSIDARVIKYE